MADYPIIDSHIHLYPSSEVDSLAWATPENPIAAQRSVDEYRAATGNPSNLKGFIFLETDRKHDLASGAADGSGWEGPLAEVAWLRRIAEGTPREGEGHSAADASLCLGIVPWAPLPSGPEVLDRYLDRVQENVWWDDVCEDAATFKGAGPRYVRGGGAREASDKVFQHNGEGWLHIDGFYANKYGKFYRSCGNCSQQFQRHVNITNFVGIQGTVVGVNQNYGDTAELSNYCLAKVGVVCTRYNGCVKPCEAGEVGEGELEPFCKINGDDWS
ncbi:hypothetical protein BN1723_009378 [Verticillium longisporum]|uniref:Pectate lyase n=1 Tax=Verticillium longisporum TaxID=100787 RepID=A0A0G4KNY8_VERLO|nr:hypothetical protein BN1723_009378 [Verticillium longisporum]